jgi:hypothetical protein
MWHDEAGGSDTVTLSGETASRIVDNPADAYARIKVDNDGNMYKSQDGGSTSWSQIDSTNDWVRPTTSAPGDYEVRFTSASNTPTSSTAAEDTWHDLDTGDFIIYNSRTSVGTKNTNFTIEIRENGGSVLDSASYTCHAQVQFDTILC